MPSKANTKKTLQDPSSKTHPNSNSNPHTHPHPHPHSPTPPKQSKTSPKSPLTPPSSIHTIDSPSDSYSDSGSEYSNHTSPSDYDYVYSSTSSPTPLHAPETPSLEAYQQTLDAQIIEYFHAHPDKPYLQSPSPSHSNAHSFPPPPPQPPLSSLSHLDHNLYNKLLRSRRYGHLALCAYENELARQKLLHRISLLNIELREKGEEMKKLVVQELTEEQGVREEAMPTWMGEVLYWGGWEEGCVGFWEGWEGYWERLFREEGQVEERPEGRGKGKGVWRKWGRGIRGVFGNAGKRKMRGEDYEMM